MRRRIDEDTDSHPRPRRPPPVATPAYLRGIAETYVGRYWGPSASVRRVLMRHLQRSVQAHGTDLNDGLTAIASILADFAAAGMVDDARFADLAAHTLHGRGKSRAVIGMQLRARGLGQADVTGALASLQADELSDRDAARNLAKRRRLGPFRVVDRLDHRQKDLQAMMRAGFAYGLAKDVIDGVVD